MIKQEEKMLQTICLARPYRAGKSLFVSFIPSVPTQRNVLSLMQIEICHQQNSGQETKRNKLKNSFGHLHRWVYARVGRAYCTVKNRSLHVARDKLERSRYNSTSITGDCRYQSQWLGNVVDYIGEMTKMSQSVSSQKYVGKCVKIV